MIRRRKTRHRSEAAAEAAMWAVCAATGKDESDFKVEKCKQCGYWHIRKVTESGYWCGW